MGTQLADLLAAGQSIWLDNIRRNMFASGDLKKLIAGGLRGMTSNPTIFEKAIGAGNDYDAQLKELIDERDPNHVFEALAIDDIRHACDEFRALYDATSGADGFVSLEVSPLLAADTQGTTDAAQRLWKMVDRPNVMIKIPATPEGIPAITATIAKQINVNVTLIFSLDTYEAVANAYIAGLEQLATNGGDLQKVASVASVFVSRIDTAVDKLLDDLILKGESQYQTLLGKTGIANLRLTYARFRKIFESERFTTLRAQGAHPQRPLWASTGTKNPKYSDLMYVETVVGPHTVNTVPPATLDALLDHGKVTADTVESDLDDAHATIEGLANAKISLFDVTQKLQVDGVKSFADSYNAMLAAIASKQKQLAGGERLVETRLGKAEAGLEPAFASLASSEFLAKLWKHDASPARGRLDFPAVVLQDAGKLEALAQECAKTFAHVVVLGDRECSLAPAALRATFGVVAGFPTLHVPDASDLTQIRALEAGLDLGATLFIVSSKSDTATQPEAAFRFFYARVVKAIGADRASKHFIAIAEPDSRLAREAREAGFLRTFENDPETDGHASALSYFAMVPAALAGYDIAGILDRGLGGLHANSRSTAPADAPGVRLGAAIGTLARAGRDKLTIVTNPAVAAFGPWARVLIARGAGMRTSIVAIEGETLGSPGTYGDDRVFVYVGYGLPEARAQGGALDAATIQERLEALEAAGHPTIRLRMKDALDIGEQFALWDIATSTIAAILESGAIDALGRQNARASQDEARRLLAQFAAHGTFDEREPTLEADGVALLALAGSAGTAGSGHNVETALAKIVARIERGDHVVLAASIERSPATEATLHEIRIALRDALKVATTVVFGPCVPNTGVVFQLTSDTPAADDLPIPGMPSFATLARAQALADFEVLDRQRSRGARVHLAAPLAESLQTFQHAILDAVLAKA